jgi:epoxyqueuosine reductase
VRELREAIGNRIYGCDDCQEVCPPSTKSVRVSPGKPLRDAPPDAYVDPTAILAMSDGEILARFGRWYIHDREPRWVRRNALVVLGNTAALSDRAARAAVEHCLVDVDPFVRAHAVWAAARIGHLDLLPTDDPDDVVRGELQSLPAPRRQH